MPTIQPPNVQPLRPQHLTQVGHEGNPVTFIIPIVGVLDSPNPFDCTDDGCSDQGGPILVPPSGGGGGGGGEGPTLPLTVNAGSVDCVGSDGATTIVVTGGTAPYTYSTNQGSVSDNGNGSATWTPPVNQWSGNLTDVAYHFCTPYTANSCSSAFQAKEVYNCYGDFILCTNVGAACGADHCINCGCCDPDCTRFCITGVCSCCDGGPCANPAPYLALPKYGSYCDGIAAIKKDICQGDAGTGDCKPCQYWITWGGGITVTVTDANGQQYAVVLASAWPNVP